MKQDYNSINEICKVCVRFSVTNQICDKLNVYDLSSFGIGLIWDEVEEQTYTQVVDVLTNTIAIPKPRTRADIARDVKGFLIGINR